MPLPLGVSVSGGSYDYISDKIEYAADTVRRFRKDPLSLAFARHLEKVAKAMHEIEWVDSGDNAPGRDAKAMRECLSDGAEVEMAIEQAEVAMDALAAALKHAKGDSES